MYAFYNCYSLTSITIPSSVTGIGREAFSDCYNLKKVIVNDIAAWCNISFASVSNPLIYAQHLYSDNYTEITDLVIPNNVTSIGRYAFINCSNLTSVSIPNSVTSIGTCAFENCTGLTSIDIPSSVTSISEGAFSGCSGLTSVAIPNSVTTIGNWAFYECSSLASVTIPNSVTHIEGYTFEGCSNLTSVKVDIEIPLPLDTCTFSNRANATLYVPAGSKALYEVADYWKDFKEIVEFSSEPTSDLMVVANAINLVKGTSQALTVIPNSADVTWTSSDTLIATVSSDGVVTGVKAGDVTITCTSNGVSSTPFPVHVISIGDVDNDGTISVTDVTTLVNMILGKQ